MSSITAVVTAFVGVLPLADAAHAVGRETELSKIAQTAVKAFYQAALYASSAFVGGFAAEKVLGFAAKLLSLPTDALLAKVALVSMQVIFLSLLAIGANTLIKKGFSLIKIDTSTYTG